MTANMTKAIALGGREWTGRVGTRVYLDADVWAPLLGLDITYYKSNNISGATLRGAHISNAAASATITRKVWVDEQGVHADEAPRKSVLTAAEITAAVRDALAGE